MRHNSIEVILAGQLLVGDVIAMEFLNGVISGEVTAVVHYLPDGGLSREQHDYIQKEGLEAPSISEVLVLGRFVENVTRLHLQTHDSRHMYLEINKSVAVLAKKREK